MKALIPLSLCILAFSRTLCAADSFEHGRYFDQVHIPVTAWVTSRDHALPDSLASLALEENDHAAFDTLVRLLLDGKWAEAAETADSIKYQLVSANAVNGTVIIASDDSGKGERPILLLNLSPVRNLIVEAPHVPFETGTAEQAVAILERLGARAAIISGAHRCASKTFTTCDGKTSVCGASENYRDSDVSHNINTLFHSAHLLLAERWQDVAVISLHGMRDDDQGIKTSLIISDGIRSDDIQQKSMATKFRFSIAKSLIAPGQVASCNVADDDQFDYRPLCGYTNVQGRHINGDANACQVSVDTGTGRFIHVEQDWRILRPFHQGWTNLENDPNASAFLTALGDVIPKIGE